jgi:hypothetical protein
MPISFEADSDAGPIRLHFVGGAWFFEFNAVRLGAWPVLQCAIVAISKHETGLAAWDASSARSPKALSAWQPLDTASSSLLSEARLIPQRWPRRISPS